jgi:glutamine transport system substrate-binding protein
MKIIALSICILCQIVLPAFAQDTARPIRIAVKEFPPFVFKDLRGFSIDMARLICERHGLKPEFVYYNTVPAVLKAVETGECDLNFSGTTITAGREKLVDFSHPFFDSGLIVAVKATSENATLNFVMKILKAETVDAVVYDAPALMYIAKKDPEIKVAGAMFDVQKYGVAFPQGGGSPYKELFNIAILEMQGSGEYRRVYNKWF